MGDSIVGIVFLVVVGFLLIIYSSKKSKNEELKRMMIAGKTKHHLDFGRYLYGFPISSQNITSTCHDTGVFFEFYSGPHLQIGTIPKNIIFKTGIDDKTSIRTHFSALGIATFGALGLGFGQNALKPAFYFTIFIRESDRIIPLVFEFDTIQKAYDANDFIRQHANGVLIEPLSSDYKENREVDAIESGDIEGKLKKLQSLKENGLITEEEFNNKKIEILNSM